VKALDRPVRLLIVALGVVLLLSVALAVLFSSPDDRPITIREWSREDPIGFLATATDELGQTSETAEYGPPYDHGGPGQHAAFLHPQSWLGVGEPIDTPEDYVIGPLRSIPDPKLQAEISEFQHAPHNLKIDGIESMERTLTKASVNSDRSVTIPPGEYENVDSMMKALLPMAQSGDLDGYLLTDRGIYQTDYTKPLLLIADGSLLRRRAARQHLPPHQWAMMNETGSYPGLPELWPYTFWYEIEPFKASRNADLLVWLVMAALALVLVCVPLLPGVRSIPRLIPIHRLIWREHRRRPQSRCSSVPAATRAKRR
jgi:hypothetical protein